MTTSLGSPARQQSLCRQLTLQIRPIVESQAVRGPVRPEAASGDSEAQPRFARPRICRCALFLRVASSHSPNDDENPFRNARRTHLTLEASSGEPRNLCYARAAIRRVSPMLSSAPTVRQFDGTAAFDRAHHLRFTVRTKCLKQRPLRTIFDSTRPRSQSDNDIDIDGLTGTKGEFQCGAQSFALRPWSRPACSA